MQGTAIDAFSLLGLGSSLLGLGSSLLGLGSSLLGIGTLASDGTLWEGNAWLTRAPGPGPGPGGPKFPARALFFPRAHIFPQSESVFLCFFVPSRRNDREKSKNFEK